MHPQGSRLAVCPQKAARSEPQARSATSAYLQLLSPNKHVGALGASETEWSGRKLERAVDRLVELFEAAGGRVVILAGAGLSTSAGVPDFRGPDGLWTRLAAANGTSSTGSLDGRHEPDFSAVLPTPAHDALAKLVAVGLVDFVITQNVDGLEQRAGIPRSRLAVIHGCLFEERCGSCGAVVLRDRDSMIACKSGQLTGRICAGCGGAMGATLLDWDDAWNTRERDAAEAALRRARLCLVLGSSLRVEPAGLLPEMAEAWAVVNLQALPKERSSRCVCSIRARCDVVVAELLRRLVADVGAVAPAGVAGVAVPDAGGIDAGASVAASGDVGAVQGGGGLLGADGSDVGAVDAPTAADEGVAGDSVINPVVID